MRGSFSILKPMAQVLACYVVRTEKIIPPRNTHAVVRFPSIFQRYTSHRLPQPSRFGVSWQGPLAARGCDMCARSVLSGPVRIKPLDQNPSTAHHSVVRLRPSMGGVDGERADEVGTLVHFAISSRTDVTHGRWARFPLLLKG